MRLVRASLRDFRNYERAELELGATLTVVSGPNGAGKTNLLEAVYFGCTGSSPRTSNERELVRRGATVARVGVDTPHDEAAPPPEAGLPPGRGQHPPVGGPAGESPVTSGARPPRR